jgi:hypothetical protein
MAPTVSDDSWNPYRSGSSGRKRSVATTPAPDRVGLIDAPAPHLPKSGSMEQSRRKYDRIPGPFDGRRDGLIETPVRLYDLSMGGCFVNSLHDQEVGTIMCLKLDLPYEGWITAKAETVHKRLGFGYAVRFIEMSREDEASLERSIRQLQNRLPSEE